MRCFYEETNTTAIQSVIFYNISKDTFKNDS